MNIWLTLGIDPTDDMSLIRKTYARLLKIHHPEDDPAGYQRLREAYHEAMRWAKEQRQPHPDTGSSREEASKATGAVDRDEGFAGQAAGAAGITDRDKDFAGQDAGATDRNDGFPGQDAGIFEDGHDDKPLADMSSLPRISAWPEPEPDALPVDREQRRGSREEFMAQLDALYQDLPSRLNVDLWLELLNQDALWQMDRENDLARNILSYLNEHYFLPEEVWDLLVGTFHWKELASEDPEAFLGELPKVYAYAVNRAPEARMSYSAVLAAGDVPFDTFFRYREALASALIRQEKEEAQQALAKALALFEADPDLLRLQTEYYWQAGDTEKSLAACEHYIRLAKPDNDMRLLRVRLLIQLERVSEALDQLDQIAAIAPELPEVLSLRGQCYRRQGRLDAAESTYNHLLELNSRDVEAVVSLAQIHTSTRESLPRLDPSQRKEAKQKLRSKLSRHSWGTRLGVAVHFLMASKWLTLIGIFLLLVLIAGSWHKHVGIAPWAYASQQYKSEAQVITTIDELENLPKGINAVRVKLSKATFVNILELNEARGKGSGQSSFIFNNQVEDLSQLVKVSGYLCMGYLDGTAVIFLANEDQFNKLKDTRTIEVDGIVRELPSGSFMTLFEQRDKEVNYLGSKPLSNYYLNTKYGISGSDVLPPIPFRIYVYVMLLGMFLISLNVELRRTRRFLQYR